jgi:hypothetical protein
MEKRQKIVAGFFLLGVAPLLVAEGCLASIMFPIRTVPGEQFWDQTASTTLAGPPWGGAGFYVSADHGHFVYASFGYHGLLLSRVSVADAERLLAAAETQLRPRAAAGDTMDDGAEAYRRWQAVPGPVGRTVERYFTLVRAAQLDRIRSANPAAAASHLGDERDAKEMIAKTHRYWATVSFDAAWLVLVLACALLPFWRHPTLLRFASTWTLLPLLFHAPHFLGFASFARPPWGPTGGVLYPWLLFLSGGTWLKPWEVTFLNAMPHPLAFLSQDPAGPVLSITGAPGRGPLLVLYETIAAIAAAGIADVVRVWLRQRRDELRGLDVIPGGATLPNK